MGDGVLLLSSAEETAQDVYETLRREDLLVVARGAGARGGASHRFASSGDPATFATLGARFLGPEVQRVEFVTMDGEPEPLRR